MANDGTTSEMRFSIVEGPNGVGTLSFAGEDHSQLERVQREAGTIRTTTLPARSLQRILRDDQGPIDFVSIDVEGKEMDVLRGFDLARFRPRVVIIEDNSNGADKQVGEWFSARGYEERFRCEHNVFYTNKNKFSGFHW